LLVYADEMRLRPSDSSCPWWTVTRGDGPLVAVAVHAGHETRSEVRERLALDPRQRLHEEDPLTDQWVAIAPNHIVVHRSRFEVDLNRPRARAVYRGPDEAWGLDLWRNPPDDRLIAESLAVYDSFYAALRLLLDELQQIHGAFILLDLHSYNFRRAGPEAPPADADSNPDINIGTDGMARERWAAVVDGFMEELRRHEHRGRPFDVRENVRFKGGHLPHWVHQNFRNGCAIAVEVKKFFMDEWTGAPLPGGVEAIENALAATIPLLRRRLESE
jgi:N-formylglutamate amidohydrolase